MTRDAAWWHARLAEWKLRPYAGLPFVRDGMIDVAHDFIDKHHAPATEHGWQAAHLLSPHGLAYRWWPFHAAPDRIAWTDRQLLFKIEDGAWVGLQAERDGTVKVLRGDALTALKGWCIAFTTLEAA